MGKQELTFEEAVTRLEQIVNEIEQGKVPLETSIERYAEGVELVKRCRAIIATAEQKIQVLSRGQNDSVQITGEVGKPTNGLRQMGKEPPAGGR